MARITFLGAGSTIFAKNLLSDCLSYPDLQDSTFVLYDIDEKRLKTSLAMAHHVAKAWKTTPDILATTDAEEAFSGADYVLNMIQVGGYKPCTVTDFEIPKKYGLRQTIGDTLGIGGIFRALRTIPVMLDYASLMEEVCPTATMLNYVNPMAMNTWAMLLGTDIRTVGLCHSVQSSYRHLATAIGVNPNEVNYTCAGINHMAFYLTLEHNGEDLYPRIFEKVASGDYLPEWDKVRLDMMLRFGYYITESSEHFSEYVPWFIKRDRQNLITEYHIPLDEYPRRCEEQLAGWARMAQDLETGKGFDSLTRTSEYGAAIIHAMESNDPTLIHGNVLNDHLIDNLPDGCCVEVPCLVDKNGIQPIKVGPLPPQLAALDRLSINVQELVVAAVLTNKKEYVYHAAMMDPHTSAELDPEQIYAMVDELFEAHGEWIALFLQHVHDHGDHCGCQDDNDCTCTEENDMPCDCDCDCR